MFGLLLHLFISTYINFGECQSIINLYKATMGGAAPSIGIWLSVGPEPKLPEYLNSEMLFSYGRVALLNSSVAMRL